jgi:hypothetical protein
LSARNFKVAVPVRCKAWQAKKRCADKDERSEEKRRKMYPCAWLGSALFCGAASRVSGTRQASPVVAAEEKALLGYRGPSPASDRKAVLLGSSEQGGIGGEVGEEEALEDCGARSLLACVGPMFVVETWGPLGVEEGAVRQK